MKNHYSVQRVWSTLCVAGRHKLYTWEYSKSNALHRESRATHRPLNALLLFIHHPSVKDGP